MPRTVAWPVQNFFGGKSIDFKRATVFCLGHRLSKHKMTRYATSLGGIPPWPSWLRLWPRQCCDCLFAILWKRRHFCMFDSHFASTEEAFQVSVRKFFVERSVFTDHPLHFIWKDINHVTKHVIVCCGPRRVLKHLRSQIKKETFYFDKKNFISKTFFR